MTTGLVLIDIQNDYFPGGRMELEGSDAASERARQLLDHFRQARLLIFHIQHISTRPGATFFIPGTPGVETHANVCPAEGEPLVQKHFPNSFRETTLLEQLRERQVTHLVIAGMMTHMCVDATTRAAFDLGFNCLVASDGCATRALKWGGRSIPAAHVHGAFLAALNGTYGQVQPAQEIIAQLAATK